MVKLRRIRREGGAGRPVLKYGTRKEGEERQLARNAFESERIHTVSPCARKEQRPNEILIQYTIYYRWMPKRSVVNAPAFCCVECFPPWPVR